MFSKGYVVIFCLKAGPWARKRACKMISEELDQLLHLNVLIISKITDLLIIFTINFSYFCPINLEDE